MKSTLTSILASAACAALIVVGASSAALPGPLRVAGPGVVGLASPMSSVHAAGGGHTHRHCHYANHHKHCHGHHHHPHHH